MISDTHGKRDYIQVPDGDILIHAGDITSRGETWQVEKFNHWLGKLPHKHKIVIAGNHDFCFERNQACRELITNAVYLQDAAFEAAGFKFYGSPWQPWFHDWAFNLQRGPDILAKWKLIPTDTDILITHGPPKGHGDLVGRVLFADEDPHVGCQDLLDEVTTRIKPKLHVFGHIHEAYGRSTDGQTIFVNACNLDLGYKPVNPPLVVDL